MLDLTPDEWIAIRLSLKIAIVATIVALPFGIAVAWVLARKDFWGKTLVDGVVHLPLVLPPVVTGYLLLITFRPPRKASLAAFLADHFGIVFSFRWTGAALACGVMAFSAAGFARSGCRFESDRPAGWRMQPSTLGANRLWVVRSPSRLPLALPGRPSPEWCSGLRQGAGRVRRHHHLRLQHPRRGRKTLSAAIYTFTQIPNGDAAADAASCVIAIVIALAALVASEWFARRAGMRYHGD